LQYSKLSNLKIPFIIPRRGKGHTEVISYVDVTSDLYMNAENFIEFFIPYQKKVINKKNMSELCNNIISKINVNNNFSMSIRFKLPIDRLSCTLDESICFYLDCTYSFDYFVEDKMGVVEDISMIIDCPIRIKHISTLKGNLTVHIVNPKAYTYFEDILDIVQRHGNIVIYPVNKISDKDNLIKEIDEGKTIDDYLNFIKTAAIHKKISEKGRLIANFEDIYGSYILEKGVDW
jgi:hypothetical protein